MDEWANSLKELEMLLPPTSGGSVTGVCFITKNVQIVCGENTAEYTRYIFTIYTASHNPWHWLTMVVEVERDTHEDNCCRDNRILCFIRSPILVSLVSVYGGYC